MARLNTLKPRIQTGPGRLSVATTADNRITGRTLQAIRLDMWKQDPNCAECGRITAHPYGYEIDHIIPLHEGGADDETNRQLLCATDGDQIGCHDLKTQNEAKK